MSVIPVLHFLLNYVGFQHEHYPFFLTDHEHYPCHLKIHGFRKDKKFASLFTINAYVHHAMISFNQTLA